MLIPTLTTDRLRLVPPSTASWEAYERFYTDAEASRWYGGPLSVRDAWARLASDVGAWHLQGFGVWVIQRQAEGDIVGTCGFWQAKGWPRELTWWLLPEARGQGVASEASRAAIRHGYEVFQWESVGTYMKDQNAAARALALRLGGEATGRQVFPDGLPRDLFRFPKP
jgi:[ribosomal protein S5]-alanine N-acetyltransferase